MSYRNLINSSLDKAFIMMKDLVIDVIFTPKNVGAEFDFNTKSAGITSGTPITIQAVFLEDEVGKKGSKKTTEPRSSVKKRLLFKAADIPDYSLYSEVTINSEVWKLGSIISETEFVIYIEVYREV